MRDYNIEEQIKLAKSKDISPRPRSSFWASDLGHPCDRYIYYSIVNWQEKKKPSSDLAFVYEGGKMIEEMAKEDFRQAGFQIFIPEVNYFTEEIRGGARITGRIDIRVAINGKIYTGEIKGITLTEFLKIQDWKDFLQSKSFWLWKYPAQLQLYLYMRGEEKGFFYLKSIPGFKPKFLWVELDFEYVESLLQKAERIWEKIQKKEPPERCALKEVCQYCDFQHICLPEFQTASELIVTEDQELLALLRRYEELKPLVEEFEEINQRITELVQGKENLVVGEFLVRGKWIERKTWEVPEEIRKQYGKLKITKYWKKEILKI